MYHDMYENSWRFIPNLAINIDTSINATFMAEKLNAAKSYFGITDC